MAIGRFPQIIYLLSSQIVFQGIRGVDWLLRDSFSKSQCPMNRCPPLHKSTLLVTFAAGTGTRAWIGVKVFCDDRNNLSQPRWWCGWATRDQLPNGTFLDSATMHAESMPIAATHNELITTPTNPRLVFHIDIGIIVHPM